MMKKLLLTLLLSAAACGLTADDAAAKPHLKVSTTIDFLDFVFDETTDADEYYPLDRYEKAIARLAESGIKKIYLRVNVCGLTLYPTRVALRYGDKGNYHWGRLAPHSKRLIGTLDHYDVCTETIRLGHKYGMEVWAWDSIWDDAAYVGSAERGEDTREAEGEYPLMDPYFRKHPDLYLWR